MSSQGQNKPAILFTASNPVVTPYGTHHRAAEGTCPSG